MDIICFRNQQDLLLALKSGTPELGESFHPDVHGAYLRGKVKKYADSWEMDDVFELEPHMSQEFFRDTVIFEWMKELYQFEKPQLEIWCSLTFMDTYFLYPFKKVDVYVMVKEADKREVFFSPEGEEKILLELHVIAMFHMGSKDFSGQFSMRESITKFYEQILRQKREHLREAQRLEKQLLLLA